ncbi:lysylphosphatidylglycerol synthase domain-containing protein [Blastochloris tepida]|uniref:Membrane protein n=1 Tax=Blastochloris tepida TaxID=2233851 RepID=A0A348G3Y8_9HYPH|nr:lysylphosphatidylglycerol synthase domain-containing protein [Blastochloris tepida]BBF94271.1 membrane protein [Blastochloris tepida]
MAGSLLSRVGHLLRNRIGWHRLGLFLSVLILGIACYVLWKMLHGINFAEVGEAFTSKPVHALLLAGLFVVLGYFTLTFYDWFGLHTIGKGHIPYRVAALAGFSSYSIGHNVGATVFTGGTVRYRLYSGWGLNLLDVARLAFVAGLTFWLGNITVLGIGIFIHPEAASAVDQLPPVVNRIIAVAALCGLVAYVIWIGRKPRIYGRGSWYVTLPARGPTLLQIVIGVVDLTCCALAMFVLMPDHPDADFITVAVVFITATLLGFASHTPGGIGVFDAAMLVAFTSGKWGVPVFDKEQLLASLLLFRVFYYLMPFAVALVLLAAREIWLGGFRGLRDALSFRSAGAGASDETNAATNAGCPGKRDGAAPGA